MLYIIINDDFWFFGVVSYFPVTFVSLSIKNRKKNEKYILIIPVAFRLI